MPSSGSGRGGDGWWARARALARRPVRLPRGLRSWKLWLGVAVATTLVAAGVLLAAVVQVSRQLTGELASQRDECLQALEEALPAHRERLARLRSLPVLTVAVEGGDAGPVLNSVVPYPSEPPSFRSRGELLAWRPQGPRETALPPSLVERLRRQGWVEEVAGAEVPELDTSWLEGLERFGFWEVTTGRPVGGRFLFRTPWFGTVRLWSRAAALRASRGPRASELAAQLRELARLMVTTEEPLGIDEGLGLLHDPLPLEGWRPLDGEVLGDARRAQRYLLAAANPWLGEARWLEAGLEGAPAPLRCAALSTAVILDALDDWIENRQPPPLPESPAGCRFELARAEASSLALDKPRLTARLSLHGHYPTDFEQLGLWGLESVLLPLGWSLQAQQGRPFCSRESLAR